MRRNRTRLQRGMESDQPRIRKSQIAHRAKNHLSFFQGEGKKILVQRLFKKVFLTLGGGKKTEFVRGEGSWRGGFEGRKRLRRRKGVRGTEERGASTGAEGGE